MILHAKTYNGDNRTLCGIADEGACTGSHDDDVRPVYARIGEDISCSDCRRIINHCKTHYNGYRVIKV